MSHPFFSAWITSYLFASFFTSPTVILNRYKTLLPYLIVPPLPKPPPLEILTQQYSALFWGTDDEIHIPLWASVSDTTGPLLANQTTLDIIHFYHRWGYTPRPFDNNPPDFIGEQFFFCEYLHACILHAHQTNRQNTTTLINALNDFTRSFLAPTFSVIAEAVAKHSQDSFITGAINLMQTTIQNTLSFPDDVTEWGVFQPSDSFMSNLYDTFPSANARYNGPNAPVENSAPCRIHTAGYNDCGGKCSLDAHVEEGCVLRFTKATHLGNPHMNPCIRLHGYRHTYLSPKRLRFPLLRTGKRGEGKFKRITWEQAIDILSTEWIRIRDTYGPGSRFVLYGTGVTAMIQPKQMVKRLLNLDGGYLAGYNSYSDACAEWGTRITYGDARSGNSPEDHSNSRLIILWGNNPKETIFGSERAYFLEQAKKSGTKIIVIDPRRSDSVLTYANEWIGIIPSTDSALADGMAYVIWTERLWDKQFMDRFCLGFDDDHMPPGIPPGESYEHYLFGKKDGIAKTPEWAASVTGIPAETIIWLAREYATTKPACLWPGWGPQRTGNGEQTVRSLCMLACLTGNVGIPGGGAAGAGWVNRHAETALPEGKNPFPGSIPNFLWTRGVDNGPVMTKADGVKGVESLENGIKMLFCMASNTLVNQHSDINDTIRILSDENKCEFIVASDIFLTSSARFADLVLPAASGIEVENMGGPWSYGNYLLFMNRVRKPLFECRFEWDWLREVAQRLGVGEEFEEGKPEVEDWLRYLYAQIRGLEKELPAYEEFKQAGGYNYKEKKLFIAYEKQRNNPEENPFPTESGKIEIFSKALYEMKRPDDIPAVPKYVPCREGPEDVLREKFPLQLIGWHSKRRCHSIHNNNVVMDGIEPLRLWMNEKDAAKRDIHDGDMVEVFNDRGRVQVIVQVTGDIVKGVVGLAEGGWYKRGRGGVDVGGSINVLTGTGYPTPAILANPQHTNLVEVSAVKK